MLTRHRTALLVAAALLVAGIALFTLADGAVWLKVFGSFLMGMGATRLVLALRQRARAARDTAP